MQKNHIHYFDYLRLMAAMGVIYMHTAASPLRGGIDPGWHGMNILTSLAFTAVPLFFMMSGYLMLSSEKTADVSYLLKKRLPHLLVPLAGWTVVAVLYSALLTRDFSVHNLLNSLVSAFHTPAWVHFWYMYTLIALYVLSPILYGGLRILDKTGHRFLLSIIGLISLQAIAQTLFPWAELHIDLIDKLTVYGGAVALFLLGYYLGHLERKIPNLLLGGIALVTLLIIILGTWLRSAQSGQYDSAFQNQTAGFEVVLAACIFLLFKQNCNRPCKFFQAVPVIPLSLAIYLMHNLSLSMIEGKMVITTFGDTLWVTAVNFLLCYFVMKTVATIKPLCYLATGMTYDAACSSCNWIYTFRKKRSINKKGLCD